MKNILAVVAILVFFVISLLLSRNFYLGKMYDRIHLGMNRNVFDTEFKSASKEVLASRPEEIVNLQFPSNCDSVVRYKLMGMEFVDAGFSSDGSLVFAHPLFND